MDFTLENSVANFLKLSGDNFRFQIKKKKKEIHVHLFVFTVNLPKICIHRKSIFEHIE